MGRGIGYIYKYDQQNWLYIYLKNTLAIPFRFDTSIQTQPNSDSDASVGENDETSAEINSFLQTQLNGDPYASEGANDVS